MTPEQLEQLYQEIKTVLKERDYARASDLLRQILLEDENYKDVSRLLAQIVKIRRRRWYNDPRLWRPVLVILILGLFGWLSTRVNWNTLVPSPSVTQTNSRIPSITLFRTLTSPTPSLTPTPLPLIWQRLNMGLVFPRDGISAIVADPTGPDVIYLGTYNGGIYKTIDGGLSWFPVQNGLGRAWIHDLLIDPHDPQTLFASVSLGGVYKTIDGGETWRQANTGITSYSSWEWVNILIMDPQDSQHLFFTPSNGIYETRNGGESWDQVQTSSCPNQIVALANQVNNSKVLFAGAWTAKECPGGIYHSVDSGATWTMLGLEGKNAEMGKLWIYPQNAENLYTKADGLPYVSIDGGKTWIESIQDCNHIVFVPNKSTTGYCISDQIYRTTDGGHIWQPMITSPSNMRFQDLFLALKGKYILLGGMGLVITKDEGISWNERNDGLGIGRVDLSFDPWNGSILYAMSKGIMYWSSTQGSTWKLFHEGVNDLAFDPDGVTLYLYSSKGTILRSKDGGVIWEPLILTNLENLSDIATHPRHSGQIYLSYGNEGPVGFNKSLDGGFTWQSNDDLRKGNGIYHPTIYPDSLGDRLYAVGDWSVFQSTDAGNSWEPCGDVSGWLSHSSRSALAIDPQDGNQVYLASQGRGILISRDGCKSWHTSTSGLGSLFVNTLAIDPNNVGNIYAGTDGGAYVSFNGGLGWSQINDGFLGATVVYSIVVDKDSNVYAATPYGIFKLMGK